MKRLETDFSLPDISPESQISGLCSVFSRTISDKDPFSTWDFDRTCRFILLIAYGKGAFDYANDAWRTGSRVSDTILMKAHAQASVEIGIGHPNMPLEVRQKMMLEACEQIFLEFVTNFHKCVQAERESKLANVRRTVGETLKKELN